MHHKPTLITITFLFLAMALNAQTRPISLSAKNAPIKTVLAEIQTKSGYRVLYNDEVVPDDLRVSINAENVAVKEILNTILKNTELMFVQQSDELIVIKKSEQKNASSTIKGKVANENGEEMPFANIILRTLPDSVFVNGDITNSKGEFNIRFVKPGNYLLSVSFVGYETTDIELNNLSLSVDLDEIKISEKAIGLQAVTVTSEPIIEKHDKKLYFPTSEQISKSANGLQLTQRLLLPQIFVNVQNGSISYAGDKKLKILINGMQASSQEVMALQPGDIRRVDYYDNPGMRYGDDIGAVLDFIVKEKTSGGYLSSNLSETLTYGLGNGQLSGGFNFKKSQIKYYYYINHNNSQTSSLKRQQFLYPNGNTVSRTENGEKSHWSEFFQMGNISYTHYGNKNIVNIKTGLYSLYQRYDDTEGTIVDNVNEAITNFKTRNRPKTLRPSVDIYLVRQIDKQQTLALNMVGTYSKTDLDYQHSEHANGKTVSDISTNVDGKRYSLIGELFYEKKFAQSTLSAGLRHTHGNTKNVYTGTSDFKTEMNDGITYGFLQYKGEMGKLGYMGGASVTRTYFQQKGHNDTYKKWTISPMLNLNYLASKHFSIRYAYQLKNTNPSLSLLSDAERMRNNYQLNKGNPALRAYFMHENQIVFSINRSPVRSSFSISSNYYTNPIMEKTYFDDSRNMFVTTYDNQKNFHQLKFQYNLGVSLLNNHLSINGYGGYNHATANGDNYSHTRNEWFYVLQTIGDYKKWVFTATLVHLAHPFWGEMVYNGHSYNDYNLGYRFPWGQLGITSFNIFGEKARKDSYNLNKLIGYENIDIRTNLYPNFGIYGSINLNWGKQKRTDKQLLMNEDTESGILK